MVVILASIHAVFPISFRGYVASDKPVANFNLAIDQGYGERKTTAWVRVSVFGKLAEAMQHLTKGDLVEVHGSRFQVAVWSAQDKTPMGQLEVTAQRVDFIITKRGQAANTEADQEMPF
jgi:single-stranded DNA-binding protein